MTKKSYTNDIINIYIYIFKDEIANNTMEQKQRGQHRKYRVSSNFMTLALAKNCKMTKKSYIDDVINVINVGYGSKLFE